MHLHCNHFRKDGGGQRAHRLPSLSGHQHLDNPPFLLTHILWSCLILQQFVLSWFYAFLLICGRTEYCIQKAHWGTEDLAPAWDFTYSEDFSLSPWLNFFTCKRITSHFSKLTEPIWDLTAKSHLLSLFVLRFKVNPPELLPYYLPHEEVALVSEC